MSAADIEILHGHYMMKTALPLYQVQSKIAPGKTLELR
jgi:hypothetical protein